jgi:hypothetical protein
VSPSKPGSGASILCPLDRRWNTQAELLKQLMLICDLRPMRKSRIDEEHHRYNDYFDHSHNLQSGRYRVVYDDPYLVSTHIKNEREFKDRGARILHLPLHMSLHFRDHCQPRLTAPPGSRANVELMAELLILAKFETPFTEEWLAANAAAVEAFLAARRRTARS